jgi:hypothetical protein
MRARLFRRAHVPHDHPDPRVAPGECAQDVDKNLCIRRSGRAMDNWPTSP